MAATEPYPQTKPVLGQPYWHAAAVTPSDGTDLTNTASALYVGTAGALKVDTAKGETVTFGAVAAGLLPLRVKRVYSTGTVASNIVALW
jgi:hypothetical protein